MGVLVAASVLAFAEQKPDRGACASSVAAGLLQSALPATPKMAAGLRCGICGASSGILCFVFPQRWRSGGDHVHHQLHVRAEDLPVPHGGRAPASRTPRSIRLGAALAKLEAPAVGARAADGDAPLLPHAQGRGRPTSATRWPCAQSLAGNRAECFAVPLVMSAASTAEELCPRRNVPGHREPGAIDGHGTPDDARFRLDRAGAFRPRRGR